MSSSISWQRRAIPGVAALALILVMFFVARIPAASGTQLADRYRFTEMPIAMPPGYQPTHTVRQVNPKYYHLRSWISSVGAGIALNDLAGKGRDDGMCIVDPRSDQVVVTYAPTAPASDRFTPFTLNAAPLPMDAQMAPMGCVPGDLNGDGRMDLLVYYWGRTPVAFMAKANATTLSASAYQPVEVVPQAATDGGYHGPRWNTNAVNVADLRGTGHPDILLANYFPDSDVLDPHGQPNVVMNSSMSDARNAGGTHALRWVGASSGAQPTVRYTEDANAVPFHSGSGWTLAMSSADLTGDGKPEAYVANDFGKDHLFYNRSTPDRIRFTEATGERSSTTPKSFVLGHDSFKGMGVDFSDLQNHGKFDILVSNITVAWGLEESNFAFMNTSSGNADMAKKLADGTAPFDQKAQQLGFAWRGWGWDVKTGDFLNSGRLDVVQAEGFVKGKINRWPWLQEMAMTNDMVYTNPAMWPNMQPGDDIDGSQPIAFYGKKSDTGSYVNLSKELGLDEPVPSRGIATADTRGSGALDFAIARQWGAPNFYANNAPSLGNHLGLRLYRPATGGGKPGTGLTGPGVPAYGATVQIRLPDGHTQIQQLDGGGGHSGKRSFEVHFGLGTYNGPVAATVQWSDEQGQLHHQNLQLTPGDHNVFLTSTASEAAGQ
ncbi:CRTAC1 family protein [Actinomadura harenae]|nr:CRTAC1 family protein [Actinomadura harenae]